MFEVLAILGFGVLCGTIVSRFIELKEKYISKSITIVIYALLFVLGISVGSNDEVVNNLHSLGLQSLLISVFGIFGSIILAKIVYSKVFKQK
ncbi:MAG: LysO family transporter [Bacteroidales bacterium]